MATKGYDEMVGRAINDPDFRKRLLADPEGTLKGEGFEVDAEVLAQLKSIDPDAAEAAAKELGTKFGAKRAAA